MCSSCTSVPACFPPTHTHPPLPFLLGPIRSSTWAMKTAPSAFFPCIFSFATIKNKLGKSLKLLQNKRNKEKRPESLGAAPVFIINSLSNENGHVQLCACADSTHGVFIDESGGEKRGQGWGKRYHQAAVREPLWTYSGLLVVHL